MSLEIKIYDYIKGSKRSRESINNFFKEIKYKDRDKAIERLIKRKVIRQIIENKRIYYKVRNLSPFIVEKMRS